MPEQKVLEVWIAVDQDGDYDIATDMETAVGYYAENVGGSGSLRCVKLNVTLTLPEPTEVEVTVPDEAGQVVTATAAE